MAGSIKIDDGSGNYTILTNAGSLGSDKTITIPNTTGTMALTSDVPTRNSAFDEIDCWVVSADITADSFPILDTQVSRYSATLCSYPIGTGMTVDSSGHWYFAKTGIYEVTYTAVFSVDSNSTACEMYIDATDDNWTSSDLIAWSRNWGNSGEAHSNTLQVILDITDIANDSIQFDFNETHTNTLYGSTAEFKSGFIFKRLGDT